MGLVVSHLINVAYKAINFVLIHLRALNRFPLFRFFFGIVYSFGVFVGCWLLALWRDREPLNARATDFLEANKQTKKRLKVNKNLIPNIPDPVPNTDTDADVDRDRGRDISSDAGSNFNGNNIKSQFHQWTHASGAEEWAGWGAGCASEMHLTDR